MKVELTEESIKLIPESEFEKKALNRLRSKGVEKVNFEDEWDRTGALILSHGKHPWDIPNHPGGR